MSESLPPSIHHCCKSLRHRRTTSKDLTERCLKQIEERNTRLRAFTTVMSAEAIHDAVERDRELTGGVDRGVLHGIPISITDNIDVANNRTTAGSRLTEGEVAARDATVVRCLRDSGAVLIGKTNLHEFGFGATSEDSAFGAVRNPW